MTSSLYAIGDSHALFTFCRSPDIRVFWLGALTMHRLGRDGIAAALASRELPANSTSIFCAGEIDVRCHLGRISDESGEAIAAVIHRTATAYVSAIARFKKERGLAEAIVCGVVPVARSCPDNPEFPRYGRRRDRVRICRELNAQTSMLAAEAGLKFLPYPNLYSDRQGRLKRHLSDGQVHVAPPCSHHMVKALGGLIGRKLAFDYEPQPVRAVNTVIRRLWLPNRFEVLQQLGGFPHYTSNR